MKDPAVLLYINDWLNSTASMDSDCRGWYLNLILHNYDKGSLPNDIEKLAVLCNVKFSEFQRFQQVFEQVLKQKFEENEDGTITNARTQQILRAREVFKDKRSDAGKKSYLSRFFQKKFPQQAKKKAIKEFVMENIDLNIDLKNEILVEQMFEHVFELYRNEIENENKDKSKNVIPTEAEFLEFVESWMKENNKDFESKKTQVITKYRTWVDAGWKDGFGNPIKNWKLKFQNVEPHLRKDYGQSTGTIQPVKAKRR